MDMIMVDVTDIDCEEGDEVDVFGPEFSQKNPRRLPIPFLMSLITGISQRVKREIVDY